MATEREIRAVRKVLYDRKRLRKMLTEIRSIDVLMNTDPNRNLDPEDIRVTAGSGPIWFVLETGAVDPGVVEAAKRSKRVAQFMREIRRDLNAVDFNSDDKRELRNALHEHAQALVVRADAWIEPGATSNPGAVANRIHRHDKKAARSYARVKEYLDISAFEGVL